ncbi:acyltransferase [Oceanobacter mangrovi]|uniref:acyltransferase n=1 Tax=Oceanobacter mangrovi TaxID=2862510 RepID=UPI001C8EAA0B|nr:acyltransferase [Oceanobacter mangrovi]
MPILTGILAFLLLILNTLFWAPLLILAGLLKAVVIPYQKQLTILVNFCADAWIKGNVLWMKLAQNTRWTINAPAQLNKRGWYFVVSNHQSWVDILVLQYCLNHRIPLLKFFLKQQLVWVPILGFAWWALDFPFMKRYSKAYLAKYPEKKGQDLETTRRSCEKFRQLPTSVMNFLEGTRFTPAKHDEQASPFQHLLAPKAGGMAFALSVMGDSFHSMLDVTIYYPDGAPTMWSFMKGQMKRCHVDIQELEIPPEFQHGDYQNDEAFRLQFQLWVQQRWQQKDRLLSELELIYHPAS